MSITALGWNTSGFDLSEPAVSGGVEDPEIAMVLLPIVAPKDVELLLEEGGCVVLNLWRLDGLAILINMIIVTLV